jgi:glycosyltransferase involved in cell wall biosynthesis
MTTPRYSLVIPFYNEAGNILPVVGDAVVVLASLSAPYEIILVNDGSTDATAQEIATCIARWPQCRALHQPRNLGQAIHARFVAVGGIDLPQSQRGPMRPSPDFE